MVVYLRRALERLRIDYRRQQKRQSALEERMLTAFIYCMKISSLFSALGESNSPKYWMYWMGSRASLRLPTSTLPHRVLIGK
ncbi:hypothetical protein EFE22_09825 [Lactobacillus delbrueckii subsp. lactis]|nr:hypothetical protein [Lactobacillus delbrueckii subsp. lactis]